MTKKYDCNICGFKSIFPSKLKTHLNSKKHKVRTEGPEKQVCNLCGYWTYEKKNLRDHKYRHRQNPDMNIKKIIIKSKKEDLKDLENEEFIGDRNLLKMEITKILKDLYKRKEDPNEHFNYNYYCNQNINLSIYELNDFYQELKAIQ